MIFVTGDTHRDFKRVAAFCYTVESTKTDVLIILGDAGINYSGGAKDFWFKHELQKLPITLLCIHGNHEQRPERISTYRETGWHGGKVYTEPEFPSLLFAKDGEAYDLDGKRSIAIGGAYSVDKPLRLANNWGWWPDEQPSEEIKARVESQLAESDWAVDVVLTHTCPLKYIPTEVFISGVDQSGVDRSTEIWLDAIDDRLSYSRWYCGHYHTNKTIDRMKFLFEDFLEL